MIPKQRIALGNDRSAVSYRDSSIPLTMPLICKKLALRSCQPTKNHRQHIEA